MFLMFKVFSCTIDEGSFLWMNRWRVVLLFSVDNEV